MLFILKYCELREIYCSWTQTMENRTCIHSGLLYQILNIYSALE
jgi:hypothetical protein